MQKFVQEKNKTLAVAFNSTLKLIDDVLSIHNSSFHFMLTQYITVSLRDKVSAKYVSYLDIFNRKRRHW